MFQKPKTLQTAWISAARKTEQTDGRMRSDEWIDGIIPPWILDNEVAAAVVVAF
jgi:hypothetical protein